MLEKLDFLRPEEVVGIECELVKAFLSEAFAGREIRRMGWQRRKREKGVFGDASEIAKLFRKCGGNGSDLLIDVLVFEDEGGGVDRWRQQKRVLREGLCERGRWR